MREIDDSARVVNSEVGESDVREFVTIHDSRVGDNCGIYERTSLKKCEIGDRVDINAGVYVENAAIEDEVQIGPNSSIAGVTHELGEQGMEFRNDIFDRIVLREGVFIGAGAVLSPGIEIGGGTVVSAGAVVTEDVASNKIVVGSPPTQRIADLRDWV